MKHLDTEYVELDGNRCPLTYNLAPPTYFSTYGGSLGNLGTPPTVGVGLQQLDTRLVEHRYISYKSLASLGTRQTIIVHSREIEKPPLELMS